MASRYEQREPIHQRLLFTATDHWDLDKAQERLDVLKRRVGNRLEKRIAETQVALEQLGPKPKFRNKEWQEAAAHLDISIRMDARMLETLKYDGIMPEHHHLLKPAEKDSISMSLAMDKFARDDADQFHRWMRENFCGGGIENGKMNCVIDSAAFRALKQLRRENRGKFGDEQEFTGLLEKWKVHLSSGFGEYPEKAPEHAPKHRTKPPHKIENYSKQNREIG